MYITKQKGVHILFILLFIIYLILANTIILCLRDGENVLRKSEIPLKKYIENSNSEVVSVVQKKYIIEDEKQRFSLSGIAFCPSAQETDFQKKVQVLAVSEDIIYVSNATIQIMDNKRQIGQFITNENSYYGTTFSVWNMENGVYEMYIYVQETSSVSGICQLNFKIKKDNNGIILIE